MSSSLLPDIEKSIPDLVNTPREDYFNGLHSVNSGAGDTDTGANSHDNDKNTYISDISRAQSSKSPVSGSTKPILKHYNSVTNAANNTDDKVGGDKKLLAFDESAEDNHDNHNNNGEKKDDTNFDVTVSSRPSYSRFSSYVSLFSTKERDKDEIPEKYLNAAKETWYSPRENTYKILTCYFEYLIHGLKDSSIGVVVAPLEHHYHIKYIDVSISFLAPFLGYSVAAIANDALHRRIGRRGVVTVGILLQLVFYIAAACRAPFPFFVVSYGISGVGAGLIEGGWNAWYGGFEHSPQILGVLHGFYGIGGVICPLVGNALISKGIKYNYLYVFIAACSALSLISCLMTFRYESAARYIAQNATSADPNVKQGNSMKAALKTKLVWMLAATIFVYVGAEVATGGWVVTYMTNVVGSSSSIADYTDTGYWSGLAAGRIIFAFITGYMGHWELMVLSYICSAMLFAILNLAIKQEISSAVCFSLLGFFLGPLFPTMAAVATKKMPKWLHVSGVGFAAALGGAGAACMPFIAGVLVQNVGAKAVTPLVFSCLCAMMVLWIAIIKFC